MSVLQSEVYEAFRARNVPEDKAMKAATALSKRDDDVNSITSDINVITWMGGVICALQIAVFVKLFIH